MTSKHGEAGPLPNLQVMVYAVVLVIALGWLLQVGQAILMPIFIAAISVYVLLAASQALSHVPLVRRLPEVVRRAIVLIAFILVAGALTMVTVSAVTQLITRAPLYQANLEALLTTVAGWFGTKIEFDWTTISTAITERINMPAMVGQAFGQISALLGAIFMVIVYATFLMGERVGFSSKLAAALDRNDAEATQQVIAGVNVQVGQYLAVKSLVNLILAVCCFVLMLGFGVDMALFWALVIGLLNYIPYIGSFIASVLPITMVLVQFGSINRTLLFAVLLITIQTIIGNFLEPKMVGKRVNMSAFVVLVSLTVWSALWGIPGAILAIPMTSIVMIVCASFRSTRPIAILLCQDVNEIRRIPLAS